MVGEYPGGRDGEGFGGNMGKKLSIRRKRMKRRMIIEKRGLLVPKRP